MLGPSYGPSKAGKIPYELKNQKEWDPDKNKPEYQSDDDSNESYDDNDKGPLGILGTGYTLNRARQIVICDPDWVLLKL